MGIRIDNDRLVFDDHLIVRFMRTLRIPDDGRTYPLPPGLGTFPLRRVEDYAGTVPAEWLEHGGVFLPMYQREAMWLSFGGGPAALKVGVGKVCAISGKPWAEGLRKQPQDYVVTGTQPWLDGIATGKGTIRQFVAMPLGQGYTVEAQVTGEEKHGGVQLQVYRPRPGAIPPPPVLRHDCCESAAPAPQASGWFGAKGMAPPSPSAAGSAVRRKKRAGAMGLAAGGRMKQKIYPDPHGIDVWDLGSRERVFVHLVNSLMWEEITGEKAPTTPVSAKTYAKHGLPWYDLYDEHLDTVDPTDTLKGVKSVSELDKEKHAWPQQDDEPVDVGVVKKIKGWLGVGQVSDGSW